MNRTFERFLNLLRTRIYPMLFTSKELQPCERITDRDVVTKMICELLNSDKPCMIARYGAFEMGTVLNYLNMNVSKHSYIKYIKGEVGAWWWQKSNLAYLKSNAGFFPIDEDNVVRYVKLMIEDTKYLDILGVSLTTMKYPRVNDRCPRVAIGLIEPDYFVKDAKNEWTNCLGGKKVLVVHPYAESIKRQYEKRKLLFKAPNFLPDFELITIKAVQSLNGECEFDNWFDALEYMKNQMDKINYDICLIGCGAYGFNLAAHAKRTGHKAIHLGGALQLLFGIKGKRWEQNPSFAGLFNDEWIRPTDAEKPKNADKVEGGCYW